MEASSLQLFPCPLLLQWNMVIPASILYFHCLKALPDLETHDKWPQLRPHCFDPKFSDECHLPASKYFNAGLLGFFSILVNASSKINVLFKRITFSAISSNMMKVEAFSNNFISQHHLSQELPFSEYVLAAVKCYSLPIPDYLIWYLRGSKLAGVVCNL